MAVAAAPVHADLAAVHDDVGAIGPQHVEAPWVERFRHDRRRRNVESVERVGRLRPEQPERLIEEA